ncbi:MAG: single-stranded DNA-binding protein [Candidatus Nealsonbacteria bacterium DGGOD1a]|jgi:single stranded DNA-binding protein (ssb)|nr:MAG: single-stranded DNA-binding protein [Candidatus Nealsonbacteria bacterium DGGOD1a]
MNLNKVFLIGRLTRDPEIRVMPSGQQVANFGLATDRFYVDKNTNQRQQKTEFHNLVLFGRLAEIAGQYLKKGSLAMFEGRLQTRDWQDQAGNKRYRTEIIAESMQLGPRNNESSGGYQSPQTPANYNQKPASAQGYGEANPAAKSAPEETDIPIIEEDGDINVKDIPF